jgi:acylphosphatase
MGLGAGGPAIPRAAKMSGMATSVSRRAIVHGRVQGVFFRDTTRCRAQELGLGGWVRNCPDGTVEALFEGPPEAVGAAIDFFRRGPSRAEVSEIEVFEEQPAGLDRFEVR